MLINIAGNDYQLEGLDNLLPASYAKFIAAQKSPATPSISISRAEIPCYDQEPLSTFDDNNGHTSIFRSADRSVDSWGVECRERCAAPPYARITMGADFRTAKLDILDARMGKLSLDNAAMMQFAFATAGDDTLLFHSSVVVVDDRGYLFLGKSGTGKSTHSRLWISNIAGAQILNDDNPVVRIVDGRAWVYGTPWSGKTDCYHNESYLVGGIVRLWQGPQNEISRLRPAYAFAALKPAASALPCAPRVERGVIHTLEKLATAVPCYSLKCLPNAEAAKLSYRTIATLLSEGEAGEFL